MKTLQGLETDPHAIGNKVNSYFTTIELILVSKIKTIINFSQCLDP